MNLETLTQRQLDLLEVVKEAHGDQKRKYTGEPYWTHPVEVAAIVRPFDTGVYVEVALCHDLFEDTPMNVNALRVYLVYIGYTLKETLLICDAVDELTDEYTPERYPNLNRKARKELEAKRFAQAGTIAQTVKCADIIDNWKSIASHDPSFAKIYKGECLTLLNSMGIRDVLWHVAKHMLEST